MASQSIRRQRVHIFFFPFVGGGHFIPMIDLSRLFASHGATSVILTIPNDAAVFQNSIQRDQESGLQIHLHTLQLPPDSAVLKTTDMSAPPLTDTSCLQEPLHNLLLSRRPDCIITDTFHRWAADVIDVTGVPRIIFNGNCCFSRCCDHVLETQLPHNKVESDSEPFLLPGRPDKIKLCRSQLPIFLRNGIEFPGKSKKSEQNSFGQVINSFYALEPAYVDYYRNVTGKKTWMVGPVSLYNRNQEDKAERGQPSAIDKYSCLNWLDSHKPNSVLYVSFGSLARMSSVQIYELASGLEASGKSFIWVVGKILGIEENGEAKKHFPDGFEERISSSKRGLIIKGWAPQLLILEHESVGGFMTHCGWNSTLEAVCAGVPMITWPLSAEQFYNEKLVAEVLKIGLRVGSEEWASWNMERKVVVGREKVEAAVRRLMGDDGGEVVEMRRRAKGLAVEGRRAVEEGGSSFSDMDALIKEIESFSR
ncbi:LOW QUALITY PROTEIN: abscisate beta-glucosyltransferase-like [Primulina eburnea]|uniref:LOW QUALITY PROTEIN: abscisate beta-glucosyltransferase-like n=1 Tax=Primulina eburnea TaxID=1245227 RepID=UPI003C6C97B4